MNEKQKKLAATFLHDYAERLSNDGCNDWEFPDDWTDEDKVDLCRSVWVEQLGQPVEEFDETDLYIQNDFVSSYLAGLLEGE